MMKDISVLKQIVLSVEEAGHGLADAFEKKNHKRFDELRKFIIQMQKEIEDVLE